MVGAVRRIAVLSGVATVVVVASSTSAQAHPSDFETLTIDLLLGTGGVEIVEAAVVAGTDYEPFPSVEQRRAIAQNVLVALGIPSETAAIDAMASERYHEVGFAITLKQAFSTTTTGAVRIETAALQQIAADATANWLKLEVCDRHAPDPFADQPTATTITGDESPFVLLTEAERPGVSSEASTNERPGCSVWRLATADPSMTVTARLVPASLASTGAGPVAVLTVAAAIVVIGSGLAFSAKRATSRQRDWRP
jgi:hypothetical protein